MDTAVVVTFPGHFFLTRLCTQSIERCYPEIRKIYVVYDQVTAEHWPDYLSDCQQFYTPGIGVVYEFVSFDQIDSGISQCKIGWYRQQLIKCCLDQVLPEGSWLVVDGDVIFDQHVAVDSVIPVQQHPLTYKTNPITLMVLNYLKTVTGQPDHFLMSDGHYYTTSSIPFRAISRNMLRELRRVVEANVSANFVSWHVDQVHRQELIVYNDQPTKMIMHEWELIESIHHLIDPGSRPLLILGPGNDTLHVNDQHSIMQFRHGYYKDAELPEAWLREQLLDFDDVLWQKAVDYHHVLTTRIMNQCL